MQVGSPLQQVSHTGSQFPVNTVDVHELEAAPDDELDVELEELLVDELDSSFVPAGQLAGVPNASVSPHESGAQSGENVPALPTHVSKAWKSAAWPFAVAAFWSDPHAEAHVSSSGAYPL